VKAGILKIRTFRPFPEDEIADALKHLKAVAVLDRADALNAVGGPLFDEVRAALYKKSVIPAVNYVYGLGGRDMGFPEINKVYSDLAEIAKSGKAANLVTYLGVRD